MFDIITDHCPLVGVFNKALSNVDNLPLGTASGKDLPLFVLHQMVSWKRILLRTRLVEIPLNILKVLPFSRVYSDAPTSSPRCDWPPSHACRTRPSMLR